MTAEELDQKRRGFADALLDRVVQDESFRQRLLDDPDGALQEGDLGDRRRELEEMSSRYEDPSEACFEGTCMGTTCGGSGVTCRVNSCYVTI